MTMLSEISKQQVLFNARKSLGLLPTADPVDDSLIAAVIRRIASNNCPCSFASIVTSTVQYLKSIIDDTNDIDNVVDNILDKMIIGGDLLELSEVVSNDLGVKSTWIFANHPSFLFRPNGSVLIVGISADDNSFIAPLINRIEYQGIRRIIKSAPTENLRPILKGLGLTEIDETTWLRMPKKLKPEAYLLDMNERLSKANPTSEIPGLMILNYETNPGFYRGRWTSPKNHSGRFVAKRPHLYGINIWCYVELCDGKLQRFIDIPFKFNNILQRGCDVAWQLQMAIDHARKHPQFFNLRQTQEGDIFDFYSPIPQWAERRFIAIGKSVAPEKCLFSYQVLQEDSQNETTFLHEYLWLNLKQ